MPDNIKSHKKPGFYPLLRRHTFWKTKGRGGEGVKLTPLPAVLGLNSVIEYITSTKRFNNPLIL